LSRLVGITRAADISLTGRSVNPTEAERIGLVSRIVREEQLINSATEIAKVMLSKSAVGLRRTKEALNQNLTVQSLEAAVELENRNQTLCCFTSEFNVFDKKN
jgi:enoyl-CoA hydratase